MGMSKKELIRLTAIDLFAAKGFYNTSTPMIAEAAQISIGSVYNYFKNKDEILNYVFQVEYQNRETFIQDLDNQEIPITEKLKIFIDKFFSLIKDNRNSSKVIIQCMHNPRNLNLEYVHKFRYKLKELFTGLLIKAHKQGEIPHINPELVGPAVFYAIRNAAYIIQPILGSGEYDVAVDELKDFVNQALIGHIQKVINIDNLPDDK
jgi:TetR/AcrR family fatty acid metabolism transcriptional regulator